MTEPRSALSFIKQLALADSRGYKGLRNRAPIPHFGRSVDHHLNFDGEIREGGVERAGAAVAGLVGLLYDEKVVVTPRLVVAAGAASEQENPIRRRYAEYPLDDPAQQLFFAHTAILVAFAAPLLE